MKSLLWDVSGAFGDMGVLFPLAVALIVKNGFNPTALFLMAGLFYITSACYFRITMPVQPMKAMSAIAITSGLGVGGINAAGITMGLILFLIAATGLSIRLGSIFPVSVVRGIQLGLGLMLVMASARLMGIEPGVAVLAGALLVLSIFVVKRVPPLIPVLVLGIGVSLSRVKMALLGPLSISPGLPSLGNFLTGFTVLVLPQIALTFGNAIVATEATGKLLYGRRADRLTLTNIPVSMGIANVLSGLVGGAPMCHGSGGLTAHRKFGATSQRSGYIIGFALLALGVLFGRSALSVVSAFPSGILGVLLCYVGIQHSLFIKDILGEGKAVVIALTVAVAGFATGNLSIGFMAGLTAHYGFSALSRVLATLRNTG
jgi:SulP family sulfate permease